MAKITYKTVMDILENEKFMELRCADASLELMKKTWNPIQKCKCWFSYNRFLDHAVGIEIAMGKLRRELGK